ncbi:MAG: type I-E CRISPR-associated protein Cas6/Cse3/CasE [Christensenellaceae bacterium]|jgi:CRISPR system Cascade subunit CasE|nr:type I-E CRISPR-associated protein Cas6/Cse3/CasE [Christensenellaceae bacterium]
MFLSRVEINPQLNKTMWALASPQRMHAIIATSFPTALNAASRVLWRLDRLAYAQYLIVQSAVRPDFSSLIEQLGWPKSGQKWDTREYDAFLRALQPGQNWRFRLCANPVRSVKTLGERGRGKVLAYTSVDQQKDWLQSHAEGCGIALPHFDLVGRDMLKFQRKDATVTLGVAAFEGLLEVRDADALRAAMTAGIGRAKAYGCGLLTLARVGG